MKNPQISIILPVYNAEEYIGRCLESLINQTFSDIEVLCINDGSSDNSLKIIEEIALKDERIKVFSQINAGEAKARNIGLKNAKGKYLMFCDADDTYAFDMCEKMFNTIEREDVDLVKCGANVVEHYNSGRGNFIHNMFCVKEGYYDLIPDFYLSVDPVLWNKIFKKSLVDEYEITFPGGYTHVDSIFCFLYFVVAKNYFGINEKLYNYNLLPNSLMDKILSKNRNKYYFDRYFILQFFLKFLDENKEFYEEYINVFFKNLQNSIVYGFRYIQDCDKRDVLSYLRMLLIKIDKKYLEQYNSQIFNLIIKQEYSKVFHLLNNKKPSLKTKIKKSVRCFFYY